MKKIIAKLYSKYAIGLYAILVSTVALAQDGLVSGFSRGGLAATSLFAVAIAGGVIAAAVSSDDDDSPPENAYTL